MDEFLDLFLTGKRAALDAKFRRVLTVMSVVGGAFALVSIILNIANVGNLPFTVVFSALGTLTALACAVLSCYRRVFARSLVELQHAADYLERKGEGAERSRKLYEAWLGAFGRPRTGTIASAVLYAIAYITLAAGCLCTALGLLPEVWSLLSSLAASLLFAASAVCRTLSDGSGTAKLYRMAEREIDAIKLERGKSPLRISREAETAKGISSLPPAVELFLKEETEKSDFRKAQKRSLWVGIGFGVFLGVFLFLSGAISEKVHEKMGSIWDILLASLFALSAAGFWALILPAELRKRAVFAVNLSKLGEGETDALRLRLQSAWVRQQKIGNLIFGVALGAAVLLGVVMGAIGYAQDTSVSLVGQLSACIFGFLVGAAFLSFAVWIVYYCVARRKLRPIEAELSAKMREEQT